MNTSEAKTMGNRLSSLVNQGQLTQAQAILDPVLRSRTRFALLDIIGVAVGSGRRPKVDTFLEKVASDKTEGGWVVIASALKQQYLLSPNDTFTRCREYAIAANVWYATDILGERVPGPALVTDFDQAIALLDPWRSDPSPWLRRMVGVAVHFWAKRNRGSIQSLPDAEQLFGFLEPMFIERQVDALKGVGWGFKTLGRYYPDLAEHWLTRLVIQNRSHYRALMLRKALTYLPFENKMRIIGVLT